jgi:hypothetical protein
MYFMSASLPVISISKTRYMAGKQCEKRLWLEEFEPEAKDELDPSTAAIIDGGVLVGELARTAFPGGVLVETTPGSSRDVLEQTQSAMADPAVPAIFEATFTYLGTPVRVDALVRVGPDEYDLIEVKASTELDRHHKDDVAVQLWALRGLGVKVRNVQVMHPRKDYVRGAGEIEPSEYFQHSDLTEEIDDFIAHVPATLEGQREVLQRLAAPEVETGSHCNKPHRCPFFSRCHPTPKPGEHPIEEIPHLSNKARAHLIELGFRDIKDIPEGLTYPQEYTEKTGKPKKLKEVLSEKQALVRRVVVSGTPHIDREALREAFDTLVYPVHFLDFETAAALLPLYEGMRPSQPILFQFSNHTLARNGRLYHREFIQGDEGDPRHSLFRHLRRAVKGDGSIQVYSSFESARLDEHADAFPDHAEDVQQIQARLFDLLKVIREHYYHPDMRGSRSIKDVLPILSPGFGYSDLAIQNGGEAQAAYFEMIHRHTTPDRRSEISAALLDYCRRDTDAMVRVFRALRSLAYDDPTQAVGKKVAVGGVFRARAARR